MTAPEAVDALFRSRPAARDDAGLLAWHLGPQPLGRPPPAGRARWPAPARRLRRDRTAPALPDRADRDAAPGREAGPRGQARAHGRGGPLLQAGQAHGLP